MCLVHDGVVAEYGRAGLGQLMHNLNFALYDTPAGLLRYGSYILGGIVAEEIKYRKRQTFDTLTGNDEADIAQYADIWFSHDPSGKQRFYAKHAHSRGRF